MPTGSHTRATKGFTLIELILVLAIVSLMAGLVTPSFFRSLSGWEVMGEARRVSALIREAQQRAMATQQGYEVQYAGPDAVRLVSVTGLGQRTAETELRLKRPVTLMIINASLSFDALGAPSGLMTNGFQGGGRRVDLFVAPITARVRLERVE